MSVSFNIVYTYPRSTLQLLTTRYFENQSQQKCDMHIFNSQGLIVALYRFVHGTTVPEIDK